MIEELFIIKDGQRLQLDLNSSSGINLNFKSNIFGDLSKITCSYSYTFKLPLTTNNILAFDMAEDIRHSSSMVRKRLKAEFIINGIKVFEDANLYIDAVEGSYQAIMTWGVVRGLETLTNNDISIRNLPFNGMPDVEKFLVNMPVLRPEDWNNSLNILIPYRKSEGDYMYNDGKYISQREFGSTSLPVVPVQRIIDAINEYYGTAFYFGGIYDGSKEWDASEKKYKQTDIPEIISFGAVPLINRGLTEKQLQARSGTFYDIEVLSNEYWHVAAFIVWDDCITRNVFSFNYRQPEINNYFEIGNNSSSGTDRKYTFYRKGKAVVKEVSLDGYICATMEDIYQMWWEDGSIFIDESETIPKLIVYKRKFELNEGSADTGKIVYEEAATVEGVRAPESDEMTYVSGITSRRFAFKFDFRASEGKSNIKLDDFLNSSENYPYFITIDQVVSKVIEVSDFEITPIGEITDDIGTGYEIDIRSNLPDISCLTFMKSLYYMMGAFPNVDNEGRIVANFYKTLEENVKSGNVNDWSKKIQGRINDLPDKTSFALSGYSQKNYYLMKNDELDSEEDDSEDVYESGFGCIECDNETLDKTQTIFQLPYYGAFIKDASRPSLNTGHDMKYTKYNEDGTTEFCEAKPAIGTVVPIEECTYAPEDPTKGIPAGTYTMLLSIWDGFKNIDANPSYKYLQSIVRHPIVITEKINLNELDLRDLDFSTPVYIEKYNAFFAVVSITRDSKGICKCELIKLP